MKKVVLGISSGIAAYKMVDVAQLLVKEGVDIYCILTQNAGHIVDVSKLESITGRKVYCSLFEQDFSPQIILKNKKVDHIDLADKADLFVIAPATANILAKLTYGIADDFLTTSVLATTAPILVCPSMNSHMWANSVVQENIHKLTARGIKVVPPIKGPLACGYDGLGKLPNAIDIVEEIIKELKTSKRLSGKTVLVTAGGTYEPIDEVRGITNRASGKMGTAIADEAYKQGARVILLRSKMSFPSMYPYEDHIFETSKDLENLIHKYIVASDVLLHTAAVSDFHPLEKLSGKVDSDRKLVVTMIPSEKIITKIKQWNPKVILVGFKAVHSLNEEEMVKEATEKIKLSQADFVAVNDISRNDIGFGSDENEILLVDKNQRQIKIPKKNKKQIAVLLLKEIL